MSHRFYFAPLFSLALVATLSGQTTPAPAAKHQPSAIARAPDGHPDLQGTWTNVTLTPMARPPQFNGKLNLTDAEAAVYENHQTEELKSADGKADAEFHRRAGSGETGGYNAVFIDRGSELARVDGVRRTSLVIDPPDGKIPAILPEARQRMAAARGG